MATKRFTASAVLTAQVTGWTFGGTWEADDIVKVTIGSKVLSMAAGSTVIATIIDSLVTAYNALSTTLYPEHSQMTASRSSNDFRLTADTAGMGFDNVVLSTTEANGDAADAQTIGAATTVTANSGPEDWSVAGNWDSAAVPVNGDDVVLENQSGAIKYGLDQSAVTLTSLTIEQSYTGTIGLPEYNSSGGYDEYRSRYLKIGATTVNIGQGTGTGSGRIKLDNSNIQATVNVLNTGTTAESGLPAVMWKGTHSSNVVNAQKGTVGAAIFGGEVATIATLRQAYRTNQATDSNVTLGSGCTLTTIEKLGGVLEVASAVTTLTNTGGETTIIGGAITTLIVQGGKVYYNGTGTLTTGTVASSGVLDFSQDLRAKTITNPIEVYGDNAQVNDPFKVTGSVVLDLNQRSTLQGLQLGTNIRLTRGTPA